MRLDRRARALVAALAALGCGAGGLSAQGVGSIRGKVVEDNTLQPLSGVQARLRPSTGRAPPAPRQRGVAATICLDGRWGRAHRLRYLHATK